MSSVRPDLDKRLAEWVDRLLERDPGRRPDSAAAASESLEDLAESALGPRWRREALLPEGQPAPVNRGADADAPHPRAFAPAARERPDPAGEPVRPAVVIAAGLFLAQWLFLVAAPRMSHSS